MASKDAASGTPGPAPIRLVVGLGNPGARYDGTRHNIGFDVLDRLATRENLRFQRSFLLRSDLAKWQCAGSRLRLLKPRTFMNASGVAVRRAMRRWRLSPEQVLVVFDDVELPTGRLRLRKQGGAGGHNGIRSITESLGGRSDFPRLRVGVGPRPSGDALIDYVLGPWDPEQLATVDATRDRAADAVLAAVSEPFDAAMSRVNAATATTDVT